MWKKKIRDYLSIGKVWYYYKIICNLNQNWTSRILLICKHLNYFEEFQEALFPNQNKKILVVTMIQQRYSKHTEWKNKNTS